MQNCYVKAHTSFLGRSGYNNHSKRFFTKLNKHINVYVKNFSMDGCTLFHGTDGHKSVTVENGNIKLDWSKDKTVTPEEQEILYEQTYFVDSEIRKDATINNKVFNDDNKIPINIILNEVGHYYFYDEYNEPKIAYTVWESTRYPDQFFNKLMEFDQFWVPSNWHKQCAIEQGYPQEKVKVIPLGVDKEFIPLEHKPKNDKFTFLIVGRWEYRKSTLEMIRAFRDVFGSNTNVKLKLLVDNLYSNDGFKTTKERLAYYNINCDNIEILSFVNRKEYIRLLQTSDVLLSCSRGEGWNLPLCVPGNKLIFSNNNFIPIKYIKENDFIISHTGNERKVLKTFKNKYNGEIKKISLYNDFDDLELTPEHPVYAIKRNKFITKKGKFNNIQNIKPEWIKSKDINKGDIILRTTIPQKYFNNEIIDLLELDDTLLYDDKKVWYKTGYNYKGEQLKYNRFINMHDLAFLFGWYIAKGTDASSKLIFTLNAKKEIYIAEKIILEMHNIFNATGNYIIKNNTLRVTFNSTILCKLFTKFCGKLSYNKKIPEKIILGPLTVLDSLLKNMVLGDGTFSKVTNRYSYTTVSKVLARQLIFANQRLNKKTSSQINKRKRIDKRPCYTLSWSIRNENSRHSNKSWWHPDGLAILVKNIKNEKYNGYVYNLEVETDNSYLLENATVHNCESISCGTITICSNWGAQLDFAKSVSNLVNIKGEGEASLTEHIGNYCEPDFEHLKEVMLKIYNNKEAFAIRAIEQSHKIRSVFSWENAAKIAYDEICNFVNNIYGKKRLLILSPHLSTGGLPQVFYKKVESLYENYELKAVEYNNLTADIFIVQKNKLKKLLKSEDFITLGEDKTELLKIIKEFNPHYIHLEEIPENFMSADIYSQIYKNDRNYYITETTHDVNFNISNKKVLPDKFMHVSKYIADKYKPLNIPYDVIEYPIENKNRPNREDALRKLGLDPEYKHILNVGLFTPGKNQKQIFDIARLMKSEKVQFHFVGNQAGNFMHYWWPLMENKPENCIVWGERSDVENFYNCMDLFLFTSTYELNPIVIKEALSYDMKILMYNLEPYAGMYDNNKNIKFISNDNMDIINTIKEILNIDIIYPERCYITHTTKDYRETTFGLIYSILEYSIYPIIIFTANFNINEVVNPFKNNKNVIFVEYIDEFSPSEAVLLETEYGRYVNRSYESTYKILTIKSKIMLEAFKMGIKEGVYLDSDSVARPDVDDLMLEIKNVGEYPLFTRGVYDIMLDNGKGDIERPLMNYLGVENRSMMYVQSNIVVFTNKCKLFIEEWKKTCEDETILLNFEKWAPYQDETIANVLLWKHGYTKHLPMYHFNIRNLRFVQEFENFDDTDKTKYSEHMMGFPFFIDGVQMDWSFIPYDKRDVKVFHGIKKLDEMIDIIEYQNRMKNKFCIIQTCDSTYKPLSNIIFKNNSEYCRKNGYDYISYDYNLYDGREPHWQKYFAIKRHIENYDWILYLDADCMIMNYNIKLENLIDDNYSMIMENMGDRFDIDNPKYNKYVNKDYNPISSAMLFKNCKISKEFITDVYENKKIPVDGEYDNTSVRCLLGSVDKYKNSCKILPIDSKILNSMWYSNRPSFILISGPKWNDNKNMFEVGDFILHLAGYDISDRVSLAKQFLLYIIKEDKL